MYLPRDKASSSSEREKRGRGGRTGGHTAVLQGQNVKYCADEERMKGKWK